MNDTADTALLQHWTELKTLVEAVEADLTKNSRGVKAAGIRARRGLRALKTKASEIVKYSMSKDKEAAPKSAKAKAE